LAVGSDRTTMRQPAERGDGGLDQPVTGLIVEVRDQTKATAVLLKGLAVETLLFTAHATVLHYASGRHGRWLGQLPLGLPRTTCESTTCAKGNRAALPAEGANDAAPGIPWQAIIPTVRRSSK